ncbi:MAG: protein-L-isoaspartate O-methyltransferase [Patescibacteria group bacterium]
MTNERLILHLKKGVCVLRSPRLEEAFRTVDRKFFVPRTLQSEAYGDYPLSIGSGATISQPSTVAFMLEKLNVQEGHKVLDIGSGSGWTTALLFYLVGRKGSVIGLEIVPELVKLGQKNIRDWYSVILKNNRMRITAVPEIQQASRGVVGLPSGGPFDRILVSAAAREIPPGLMSQLTQDGILVMPVGREGEIQKIVRIHKKSDASLEAEEYPGFVFVPLRSF